MLTRQGGIRLSKSAFLVCLVALSAGAQETTAKVKPVFREPMLLGAHRGGAGQWPENTLVAFKSCAERWPDALLETDARLTADGQVLLLHDETVDRTTDGTGSIGAISFEAVRKLDAAYRFTPDGGMTYPYRGRGIQIPTLAEVLRALPDSRFLVDLKDHPGIADAVVQAIRECSAEDRVILASFKPAHMARARELSPRIATCYDFARGAQLLAALRDGDWAGYRPTDDMLSLMKETVAQYRITPEELKAIRGKGILLQLHTLDEKQEILEALQSGVDSILTDYPDRFAMAISEHRALAQRPR